MPQDRPPYRKMVFITYDTGLAWNETDSHDSYQSQFVALWLYQRLKYSGFPVRTYKVDEAIGGGGFNYNSIDVASPMIAVVSSSGNNHRVLSDIQAGLSKNKEVLIATTDLNALSLIDEKTCRVFDFAQPAKREEIYQELKSYLNERDFPIRAREGFSTNTRALDEARRFYGEYITSDTIYRSAFFYEYFYTNVFSNMYNHEDRIQALYDLGERKILEGLIVACLQDDPHPDVRAAAALALAKFSDYDAAIMLHEAMNVKRWPPELMQNTGLAYAIQQNPVLAEKVSASISDWNPRTLQALTSPNYPRKVSASGSLAPNVSGFDVFISYARVDSEKYAVRLANSLKIHGFEIWLDTEVEPGSQSWLDDIEEAIRKSSVMVALTSPGFSQSQWTRREIFHADRMHIPIIPIGVIHSDKPMLIGPAQGLRGDPLLSEEYDKVVEQLVAHLKGLLRARNESDAVG